MTATTAVLALALAGCATPDPPAPTPITREARGVKAADIGHLPDLTPPERCTGHVALTFDDGPTKLTPEILAVLDHYDVPATFFNVGLQEKALPRLVERELAAGHQVGNHTMTHPDLLSLDVDEALEDVDAASATHRDLTDEHVTLFRPPYGNSDAAIRAAAEDRGLTEVLWTVDSKDYEAISVDEVVENSRGMTDGGILLMHDGKPLTVEALPRVIEHYYDEGLCFGRVTPGDTELPSNVGLTHRARASD
ncbi:polysaccharide deacetylase family protein [Citricoccus sp. SGAir0253]|uniref:polysaccharide deacetylase family protein n=1 Tax=Citricoccus sp. SGAir0253 TaxID=2567881 RepID=UPI00143DBB11|nr:polysaccharide deacetylase family protein [Citricoccus sp. SGAir0253]